MGEAGDEAFTNVPAIDPMHVSLFKYRASDLFVEDASYIRLREVNLSYKLPSNWLGGRTIKSLEIGVAGRNLALWTANKQGIDPDYIPANVTDVLPPAKSLVFSIKANF